MAGTKIGAAKATQTIKQLYGQDYFARIGKVGGENGYGYGFAHGKLDPSKTGKLGGAGNRRGGWSAERKAAHSRFMKDYWKQRQPFVPDDSEFGEGLLEPSWKDKMLNKLRRQNG